MFILLRLHFINGEFPFGGEESETAVRILLLSLEGTKELRRLLMENMFNNINKFGID